MGVVNKRCCREKEKATFSKNESFTPTRVRESALWKAIALYPSLGEKGKWMRRKTSYPGGRGLYLLDSGQDGDSAGALPSRGCCVTETEQSSIHPKCDPPGVARQLSPSFSLSHQGGKRKWKAGQEVLRAGVGRVGGSKGSSWEN